LTQTPRKFLRLALGVLFGFALEMSAACAAPPGAGSPVSFAAVEWVLVEISGNAVATGGPVVTFEYDPVEARVAGSAGCNRYFGGVLDGPSGGALRLGPIGATRKMCPPPQMDLESLFLTQLASTASWERMGSRLRLLGPSGSLRFEARGEGR
jgi:heat shock protein HslJ